MAAGRSLKSLLSRRRRSGDDGEDDEDLATAEDSQTDGSVVSDGEDEPADASSLDARSTGDAPRPDQAPPRPSTASDGTRPSRKARATRKKAGKSSKPAVSETLRTPGGGFPATVDTEAMMNGLSVNDKSTDVAPVGFDEMHAKDNSAAGSTEPMARKGRYETAADRQRREHEDYRKKRDTDPAFIPNRGQFFMHDARGPNNGSNPPFGRGAWQGRGRGRGAASVGGPFSPANQLTQAERAAEQPWKHDLHDTVNERPLTYASATARSTGGPEGPADASRSFPKQPTQSRVLSFSSTLLVGTVQVRVLLPGMGAAIAFSEVPWKHYTRLPDHRPPLRRDKPVRISLPEHTHRYIFPATERSFVFIPRQMRPNQHGYHRGYQRSIGGHGYSSRRTSMYGGSVYSGSIAASRRSSFAGGSRENAFSPAGSFVGMPPPNRPIVRLPHGSQHFSGFSSPSGPLSGQHTPTSLPQIHTYPLPQQPTFQGTPTTTVHQPRPRKTISVTGIESPAMMQQQGSQDSQPFQNQLPAHMNEPTSYGPPQGGAPAYFSPRQSFAYPQQPQNGTPLSGIPEQAIHAPSFQPPSSMQFPGQPPYYPVYPPAQQSFYYSPPGPTGYPQQMPMYMPSQNYAMPQPPQHPPSQPTEEHHRQQQTPRHHRPQTSQSGMVAHESNGMVFYMPASEAQQSDQYQPAESFVPSYAMPGLPPPTPAPDSSMPYYYPPVQEMGTGVYYGAQQ